MRTMRMFFAAMAASALLVSVAQGEETTPAPHDYVCEWVDQEGRVNIDIRAREKGDGFIAVVHLDVFSEDEEDVTYVEWTYPCVYDEETGTLKCVSRSTAIGDYEINSEEEITEVDFEYEDAQFRFDENGMLVWEDNGLEEDEGRLFGHTIGWTNPDNGDSGEEEGPQVTGKIVEPMVPEYDFDALADGTYPVYFDPADLTDGTLSFTVYSEDVFDIVDINTLEVGDVLVVNGIPFAIETLERDDDILINGGLDNDGLTLRAFEEDNCWKVVMEDDFSTYTERGDAALPLADNAAFTDNWDISKEPVTVSGAEAVAEEITGTAMDYFSPLNTNVRVEGGEIVEIVRKFMP